MRAAVGKKDVVHAVDGAPRDIVSISLLAFGIDECFGVGESHAAAGAAARLEHGIGIGGVGLIEQNRRRRPRWNHEVAAAAQKCTVGLHAGYATHTLEPVSYTHLTL